MARPEWELGYNQGYAAGFDEGFEKGQREGRYLGFSDGFVAALEASQTSRPLSHLPGVLRAMNRAGLFRIILSGPAAHEAAEHFRVLGFVIDDP